jgi:nicotinic acid mononucleotide adenylyltransferase
MTELTDAGERLGVYPGSFNPLTTGHLAIADAARRVHGLSAVELTVSTLALAKEDVAHPRFEHRIEVLQAAVASVEWLDLRVTELQLLADIAEGYQVLIVGADKWLQIQDPVWYGDDPLARDAALATLPTVAIAPRDGLQTPIEHTLEVDQSLTSGVSSTAARNGNLELMVPAARDFAERTGAWIDVGRYDRWVTSARG